MNQYTDTQLKQCLAKMLPEKLTWEFQILFWKEKQEHEMGIDPRVLDTELLYLCWLVEDSLSNNEQWSYYLIFQDVGIGGNNHWMMYHATWQQQTIALAKLKNIKI